MTKDLYYVCWNDPAQGIGVIEEPLKKRAAEIVVEKCRQLWPENNPRLVKASPEGPRQSCEPRPR